MREENHWFYPVEPEAEGKLRAICDRKLKEKYGNVIPEAAEKKLQEEFGWLREEGMTATVLLIRKVFEKLGLPAGRRVFDGCQLLVFHLCGLTEADPLAAARHFFPELQWKKTALEFKVPVGFAKRMAAAISEEEGIRAKFTELPGYFMISLIPERYEKNWKGISYDRGFVRIPVIEWDGLSGMETEYSGSDGTVREEETAGFLICEAEKWPGDGENVFRLPMMRNENFCRVLQAAKGEIRSFSDLARANAFARSTFPWGREALEKIKQGEISFQELICCREDVMDLLLGKGVLSLEAVDLIRCISVGRALTEEQKALIRGLGLSKWQERMFGMEHGYLRSMEDAYDYMLKQWKMAAFFRAERIYDSGDLQSLQKTGQKM